jgi:SGNH domain (fused to AT3 domains)
VLIGPIEIPGWDIASILSRERAFGWPQSRPDHVPLKNFTDRHGAEIAHFKASLGENFLRPDTVLCDDTSCRFIIDGHSMFADSNHIAKAALFRFDTAFQPLSKAMQVDK